MTFIETIVLGASALLVSLLPLILIGLAIFLFVRTMAVKLKQAGYGEQ